MLLKFLRILTFFENCTRKDPPPTFLTLKSNKADYFLENMEAAALGVEKNSSRTFDFYIRENNSFPQSLKIPIYKHGLKTITFIFVTDYFYVTL